MNYRFAIACFFVFLGCAELFQWIQRLSLQMPVYVMGGLLLALVSNYDKQAAFPFNRLHQVFQCPEESCPPKE
jgi:hypothetical protein